MARRLRMCELAWKGGRIGEGRWGMDERILEMEVDANSI